MSFRTRVGALLLLAAALQLGTDALTAQHISVSLGENRQEVLQPGAQITLPVLVDMTNADTLDLASLQVRVTWDTTVVGYTSWSAGTFGSIQANENQVEGGVFEANLVSTTGTTGSFTAMNLSFDAGTAGSTVVALGILAAGSESGGDLLSRIVANSVSICIDAGGLLGDVTSGDLVDVIDAQQIARWLVSLPVGASDRMNSHGDVNNDGQTNIVDAQQIARWAVQLSVDYTIGDVIDLACADALAVSTTALPVTGVSTEYSQQLNATGGEGTYSWEISNGTLPAGLTLAGSTISGTPTATGTSEFTAKVTSGDGQIATRPLSIKVLPEMSVTTASLPVGIVDTVYAATLTATGGDSTFAWSITSGTLPDGLALSADTISGTPTTAATSTFTVQAESGVGQTATKELSIVIHPTLSITKTSLLGSVVDSVYSDTLTAAGGDGSYTWALLNSTTLPAGLSLNTATGEISGTPTGAGTSNFTVGVTSGGQTAQQALSVTVSETLVVTPATLADGTMDVAYVTQTIAITGGDGIGNVWSLSGGTALPTGLLLDSTNGQISGTPEEAGLGTISFTIQVTDGLQTDTENFSITVAPGAVTSPPGGRIAFGSPRSGTSKIWIMDSDGQNPTILSPSGTDRTAIGAAWSPDGTRIAYVGYGIGDSERSLRVMRYDAAWDYAVLKSHYDDGSALTSYGVPSWSPDGTRLVFTAYTVSPHEQGIYIVDADGRNLTQLNTYGRDPDWSPDGTTILFEHALPNENRDLWTIPAGGGTVTQLTSTELDEVGAVWSPDGNRIAFVYSTNVWLINADGTGRVQIGTQNEDESLLAWSPDGLKLAFTMYDHPCPCNYNQVWVMNQDGSGRTNLTNSTSHDSGPAWQPES